MAKPSLTARFLVCHWRVRMSDQSDTASGLGKKNDVGRVGHAACGMQLLQIPLLSRRTMIRFVSSDVFGMLGCEVAGR